MSRVNHVNGDAFQSDREVIAHGVNCRGVFNASFARQVARRYPEAKRAYLRWYIGKKWALGEVQFVLADDGKIIANMATQETYGRDGRHVDYDAVRTCFDKALDFCEQNGCGLAMPQVGGDWSHIEEILEDCMRTRSVEVDVHTLA